MIREDLIAAVQRIRLQGTDDGRVEAKACSHGLSSDIWETVSAFANTAGGLLLLGLDERTGFSLVEGFDLELVRDQFVSGIGDGGQPSRVLPVPHYEMARVDVDGGQVLAIELKELELRQKPCYIVARGIVGGSYKRVDDKDIRLSAAELYEYQSAFVPSEAETEIVPSASLDDLDDELIKGLIERRRQQSPRVFKGIDTREGQLERLGVLSKETDVRLAGLLAVGLYPQQFYPKLIVDVAVHEGNGKARSGELRFIDRRMCDGPLSAMIEDTLTALGQNLRKRSVVRGAGRTEEWEIPEEVLREAISNAVIHREYSSMFRGQSVSVDVYDDRIEVTSPGGLWGGKTVNDLADGESRCRNARIMSLMGAVPLERGSGSVAESQGSGIPYMLHELAARSLEPPEFVARADSFRVTLKRPGVVEEAVLSEIRTVEKGPVPERILAALSEQGELSAQEISLRLGVGISTIRYHLPRLIGAGAIVATAGEKSKRRRYRLA